MEEKIFVSSAEKPTDTTIKKGLGKAHPYFIKIADLAKSYPTDWVFTKSGGWFLKYHDKKKALFYLIPLKNEIKVSLTLRENEKELFLKEKSLPQSILDKIEAAKKYTEGYAIQFLVSNNKDYAVFEKLILKLIKLRKTPR